MWTKQLFCEAHRDSVIEGAMSVCSGCSMSPIKARNPGIPELRNVPAAVGPSGVLASRARMIEVSAALMSISGNEVMSSSVYLEPSAPEARKRAAGLMLLSQARVHDGLAGGRIRCLKGLLYGSDLAEEVAGRIGCQSPCHPNNQHDQGYDNLYGAL